MEGLTGGAYFFAYFGFLLMVIAGWLFLPRVSFAITIVVLVHKLGLISPNTEEPGAALAYVLTALMIIVGLVIDAAIIKDSLK